LPQGLPAIKHVANTLATLEDEIEIEIESTGTVKKARYRASKLLNLLRGAEVQKRKKRKETR